MGPLLRVNHPLLFFSASRCKYLLAKPSMGSSGKQLHFHRFQWSKCSNTIFKIVNPPLAIPQQFSPTLFTQVKCESPLHIWSHLHANHWTCRHYTGDSINIKHKIKCVVKLVFSKYINQVYFFFRSTNQIGELKGTANRGKLVKLTMLNFEE